MRKIKSRAHRRRKFIFIIMYLRARRAARKIKNRVRLRLKASIARRTPRIQHPIFVQNTLQAPKSAKLPANTNQHQSHPPPSLTSPRAPPDANGRASAATPPFEAYATSPSGDEQTAPGNLSPKPKAAGIRRNLKRPTTPHNSNSISKGPRGPSIFEIRPGPIGTR